MTGISHALTWNMAFVLFSWVSISILFCLALVRAAARRYVPQSGSRDSGIASIQTGARNASRPKRRRANAVVVPAAS